MSLLAPLYFLGALAIGLPILAHLIRRRPRAEMTFSSLMFLRQSPPQLTRRSRLDNWPLLLMRVLALLLLAVAFSRPFLRQAETSVVDTPGRRLMLLIDSSASMRRDGIDAAVSAEVERFAAGLQAGDTVGVYAFDQSLRTILSPEDSAGMDLSSLRAMIIDSRSQWQPTWQGTDFGAALTRLIELDQGQSISSSSRDSEGGSDVDPPVESDNAGAVQVTMISDLQAGGQTQRLQGFAWPDAARLDVRTVATASSSNASAWLLRRDASTITDASSADEDRSARPTDDQRWPVRVTRTTATEGRSGHQPLSIRWGDADGVPGSSAAMTVDVPAGESRVVRMPPPNPGDATLLLSGDDHGFDNTRYFATPQRLDQQLLMVVDQSDAPRDSLDYYIRQLPLDNPRRRVVAQTVAPSDLDTRLSEGAGQVPLLILGRPVDAQVSASIAAYANAGGRVLVVLTRDADESEWESCLRRWPAWDNVTIGEAEAPQGGGEPYAMWSQIDFQDPLFAAMADPQFNDFSKLKFWSHRRVTLWPSDRGTAVAVFDDGDPAIIASPQGAGMLWVMAAGWQPAESQLALSTKFLPLIYRCLDSRDDNDVRRRTGVILDEPSQDLFKRLGQDRPFALTRGDGTRQEIESVDDVAFIDRPGLLSLSVVRDSEADATEAFTVAVNLPPSESDTSVMDVAMFESLGVRLGSEPPRSVAAARQRQLRDIELEGRQGIWRWLLLGVLGLLAGETLTSGIRRRRSPDEAGR